MSAAEIDAAMAAHRNVDRAREARKTLAYALHCLGRLARALDGGNDDGWTVALLGALNEVDEKLEDITGPEVK